MPKETMPRGAAFGFLMFLPALVLAGLGSLDSPPSHVQTLRDGITWIGSVASAVAILYAFVQYLHYAHLHNAMNHVFCFILLLNLIDSGAYFFCVFWVEHEAAADARASSKCGACGFTEQVYSFSEPCLQVAFWGSIFVLVSARTTAGRETDAGCTDRLAEPFLAMHRRPRTVVWLALVTVAVGAATATAALVFGMYDTDGQSWCWVHERYVWFRVLFCWLEVGLSIVAMLAATIKMMLVPLIPRQRGAIFRRVAIAFVLAVVSVVNVLSRVVGRDPLVTLQAVLQPLYGGLNAFAFLWSERMLCVCRWELRGWLLSRRSLVEEASIAGGSWDPPYGFTAAIRDLPDQFEFSRILVPGPGRAHNKVRGRAGFGGMSLGEVE